VRRPPRLDAPPLKFHRRDADDAKNFRETESKFEARNPKQIQMIKKLNVPNNLGADSGFWNFSALGLFVCWFVSNFGAPVKPARCCE
jgi:hypothetical protein